MIELNPKSWTVYNLTFLFGKNYQQYLTQIYDKINLVRQKNIPNLTPVENFKEKY